MFTIISDSACDLFEEYTQAHNVHIVPMYVSFDGEHYLKEREEVDHNEFYKKMVEEGAFPKTSLPSVQDYIDAYMPSVKAGIPAIMICISSLFSGAYNCATTAKNELLEDYPDAKIAVVDSMQNTISQALFVNEAVRMRDAGLSFEDTVKKLNQLNDTGRIFFTIGSMEYLKRGGRVGKMASIIGNTLNIKPLIVLKNGELNVGGITRTRAKAKKSMLTLCQKHFEDNKLNKEDYYFGIVPGYDLEEGKNYQKEFEEALGVTCLPYIKTRVGVATACHTGPYALGIGIMRRYETL